jgi:hypothetical protein
MTPGPPSCRFMVARSGTWVKACDPVAWARSCGTAWLGLRITLVGRACAGRRWRGSACVRGSLGALLRACPRGPPRDSLDDGVGVAAAQVIVVAVSRPVRRRRSSPLAASTSASARARSSSMSSCLSRAVRRAGTRPLGPCQRAVRCIAEAARFQQMTTSATPVKVEQACNSQRRRARRRVAEATDVRQVASFQPGVVHFVCHRSADSPVSNDVRGESDYVTVARVAEMLSFYRDRRGSASSTTLTATRAGSAELSIACTSRSARTCGRSDSIGLAGHQYAQSGSMTR